VLRAAALGSGAIPTQGELIGNQRSCRSSLSASRPKRNQPGGIIIPDTAKEKPSQGEVIAVGPGGRDEAGKLIPIDVKVGDRVLFGKWSGTEVKIDGQELLIMKESDLMGIIDEPAAKKKAA
jgi:chaperonin GroES